VRVRDPFDDIDVGTRKAVLYTVCGALLLVAYAMVFPAQVALVAMLLSFPVMIFLHEGGHYLAARKADMKVTEFFVGFGPRFWSFRRGETEYGIKAIPLGGYCKVIGMSNLEEDIPEEDEPRTYRQKSWGARVGMAAAGPAVHFLIAIVLMFTILFLAGDFRRSYTDTTLTRTGQGAAAAGIEPGDKVVAVDGTPVAEFSDIGPLVRGTESDPTKPGDIITVTVLRDGQTIEKSVKLEPVEPGDPRVVLGVQSYHVPQPGVLESAYRSPQRVGQIAWDSTKALGTMFSPSGISNYFRILTGDKSEDTNQDQRFLSPVGFGKVASDAVHSGWENAIVLLIAINVFVGLFNLLPLLPFDGGHIAVATYEAIASRIRRRRVMVDMNKLMPITIAVLAVFGFIMISSVFLDITNPISNPY
jgi:membrane-associated protease RseP (regulator of RpoE activity)